MFAGSWVAAEVGIRVDAIERRALDLCLKCRLPECDEGGPGCELARQLPGYKELSPREKKTDEQRRLERRLYMRNYMRQRAEARRKVQQAQASCQGISGHVLAKLTAAGAAQRGSVLTADEVVWLLEQLQSRSAPHTPGEPEHD